MNALVHRAVFLSEVNNLPFELDHITTSFLNNGYETREIEGVAQRRFNSRLTNKIMSLLILWLFFHTSGALQIYR